MENPKMLSGYELVARGVTKQDGSLPEIGAKDVVPNGSWLEQKQIQSALECRKHLIEVARIEKCGGITHAEWRPELQLAEVKKQAGGYWQFIGHGVGIQLFLKPEEALYLLEVNSLLLKYNGVTVSLQQAYSLLLGGKISLIQYKVYSSLSRLGYKVYRNEIKKPISTVKKIHLVADEVSYDGGSNFECTNKCFKSDDPVRNDNEVIPNTTVNDDKMSTMQTSIDVDNISEEPKQMDCDTSENINETIHTIQNISHDASGEAPNDIEIMDYNTSEVMDNNTATVQCSDQITPENIKEEITDNSSNVGHPSEGITVEENAEIVPNNENCTEVENKENIMEIENNSSSLADKDVNVINFVTEGLEESVCNVIEIDSENDNDSVRENTISESLLKSESQYLQNNRKCTTNQNKKLYLLENRKTKACDTIFLDKCFEKVPDIYQKPVVTVNVPEEEFIPKNVFLNKMTYVLNIDNIQDKPRVSTPSSTESGPCNVEEVNGDHMLIVRATIEPTRSQEPPILPSPNQSTPPRYSRPNNFRSNFWRPRLANYFPMGYIFQRHFPNMQYMPRMNIFPRAPMWRPHFNPNDNSFYNQQNVNNYQRNNNKRNRNRNKRSHLHAIKSLSFRLKQIVQAGNPTSHNVQALQSLVQNYNIRYQTNLRLSEDLDVYENDIIVETIELDCDEEPKSKRRKTETIPQYEENLSAVKQLAMKLKGFAVKNIITSRHKRALSTVIKNFNKTYNSDIYMNDKYEVFDRSHISLDSSSDSECVVDETPPASSPMGKKLRNPFNILKRLSENQSISPTKISNDHIDKVDITGDRYYSQCLLNNFDKNWLPNENDFGRAEVVSNSHVYQLYLDNNREEYFYEFINNHPQTFENWSDMKIAFWRSVDDTTEADEDVSRIDHCDMTALIKPEDCTDVTSVLQKLQVIRSCTEIPEKTYLSVDFDVYNRDVANFRKSNRPKPHFRIICMSEDTTIPDGGEVAALYAKYEDDVTILFAIVGISSISYLQIKPTEIPVYLPRNDLDEEMA